MTQKTNTAHRDLMATARASRESAAAFRAQVERLKEISFEGTLSAAVEFRLMARAMNAGRTPSAALREARAFTAARVGGAPMAMAAE
jgi:hypothetical protein